MKRPVIVLVAIALALAIGIVATGAASKFTECSGDFGSDGSADAAADEAEEAGFDARVDRRQRGAVVFFSSGETGDEAAEFRATFQKVLRRHAGTPGDPGDGCVERRGFE